MILSFRLEIDPPVLHRFIIEAGITLFLCTVLIVGACIAIGRAR